MTSRDQPVLETQIFILFLRRVDTLSLIHKSWTPFLIKREMPGIGAAPKNDLNNAAKGSEEVLEALRAEGKNIQQEQSYVIGDAIFLST